MAKAYKCDKCGEYFDVQVYSFKDVETFRRDHQNYDVNVTIVATQEDEDKEFEFCGACWLKLLTKVQEDLSCPI